MASRTDLGIFEIDVSIVYPTRSMMCSDATNKPTNLDNDRYFPENSPAHLHLFARFQADEREAFDPCSHNPKTTFGSTSLFTMINQNDGQSNKRRRTEGKEDADDDGEQIARQRRFSASRLPFDDSLAQFGKRASVLASALLYGLVSRVVFLCVAQFGYGCLLKLILRSSWSLSCLDRVLFSARPWW